MYIDTFFAKARNYLIKQGIDEKSKDYVSKWITEQNLDVRKLVKKIYERTNKAYGTNEKPNQ